MINIKKLISTYDFKNKILSIYNTYYKEMYNWSYKITNNKQDAEDAIQEAFISIAKNIHLLGDINTESTKTTICIIQQNKAIDLMRKQPRYQELSDEEFNGILSKHNNNIETNLYNNCINGVIKESINKLHPQYQHTLILYHVQNRTVKEISRLLDKTPKTIHTCLSRGRKELLLILRNTGNKL